MSENQIKTCETCKFWVRGFRSIQNPWKWLEDAVDTDSPNPFGDCRIRSTDPFPRVHKDDWCGEGIPR